MFVVLTIPRVWFPGHEDHFAIFDGSSLDDFDGFHDDASGDDGVGGGDGGNDVSGHGLDVEAGLGRDPEHVAPDVGAGGHEVHRALATLVVLVPHQVVFEVGLLQLGAELVDGAGKNVSALL